MKLTGRELRTLADFIEDIEIRREGGICLDGDETLIRVNGNVLLIDHSGQEVLVVIE